MVNVKLYGIKTIYIQPFLESMIVALTVLFSLQFYMFSHKVLCMHTQIYKGHGGNSKFMNMLRTLAQGLRICIKKIIFMFLRFCNLLWLI
jgi:hypothetical protein